MSQNVASVRLWRRRDRTRGFAVRIAGGAEQIRDGFTTWDGLLEQLKLLLPADEQQPDGRVRLGCSEVP